MLCVFALVLSVPALQAQEPASALDYLPADTVICFEVSREPWERLGESTRLHAVLGLQGVQDCLAPTEEFVASFDDDEFHGFGAVLWNALAYSRAWVAVSVPDTENVRAVLGMDLGLGAVVDLGALFPEAGRRELFGGELLTVPGLGAFWRDGGVLLGAFRFDAGEEDDSILDGMYLETLVGQARAGQPGLGALPGMQRLRAEIASADDLFGVWVPGEALDFERWRESLQDEDIDRVLDVLTEVGLHDLGGFGWTLSIAAPDLLDRTILYKNGFGGPVFRREVLDAANLPARAAALPGDTALARLAAVDLGAAVGEFFRVADHVAGIEGEAWPPEGMEDHFETAHRIAAALGPVIGFTLRAEDMWTSADDDTLMIGDVWIDILDPMALDAAMQQVPEEVMQLLEQGFPVQGKTFAAMNRGDRLVIVESGAEPTETRLGDTAAFQHGMAPFRPILEQGGVVLIDFAGPEYIAFVAQVLRELGGETDLQSQPGLPRIDLLPGFDELVNLVGPTTGVWQVRPDGLYAEYRSALGYSASNLVGSSASLLAGMGSWMEAVGQEARAAEDTYPEEDF